MADIINLRMARKAAARTKAQDKAAQARARHGQTKAEKQAATQTANRLARTVDGARRTHVDPD